jgi:hypothetical protein
MSYFFMGKLYTKQLMASKYHYLLVKNRLINYNLIFKSEKYQWEAIDFNPEEWLMYTQRDYYCNIHIAEKSWKHGLTYQSVFFPPCDLSKKNA